VHCTILEASGTSYIIFRNIESFQNNAFLKVLNLQLFSLPCK
jgi:hypothetical protein